MPQPVAEAGVGRGYDGMLHELTLDPGEGGVRAAHERLRTTAQRSVK